MEVRSRSITPTGASPEATARTISWQLPGADASGTVATYATDAGSSAHRPTGCYDASTTVTYRRRHASTHVATDATWGWSNDK